MSPQGKPGRDSSKEHAARHGSLQEVRLADIPERYAKWSSIYFSVDGSQVVYEAREGSSAFVLVASADGESTGPNFEGVTFFVASPDGRRFAFGGKQAGRSTLVIDNKVLKESHHDEVAPATFSPDSRLVACEVGSLNEQEWFVVVSDGEKEVFRSSVYPETYRKPLFSPDGRLLAYELGSKKERILFLVDMATGRIVGKMPCSDCDRTGKISFNADATRMIYDVERRGKRTLVLYELASDTNRIVDLPYVWAGQFTLSPDGTNIWFGATREGKTYLVRMGWDTPFRREERGPYSAIGQIRFETVSGTSGVVSQAMYDGAWHNIIRDKDGPGFEKIGEEAAFSQDGARIAYPAMDRAGSGSRTENGGGSGRWSMTLARTDSPDTVALGPQYDAVVSPVFSPDGRYIAYRARTGPMERARRFLVIADATTGKVIRKGPEHDEVWPPVWQPDGSAVTYGARQERTLWWRVERVP